MDTDAHGSKRGIGAAFEAAQVMGGGFLEKARRGSGFVSTVALLINQYEPYLLSRNFADGTPSLRAATGRLVVNL